MAKTNSENVCNFVRNRKTNLISLFHSKCCICGFDKFQEALEFHHINPEEKDGVLSRYSRRVFSPATKELIDREVEKCEVLCANCHREEHSKRNS